MGVRSNDIADLSGQLVWIGTLTIGLKCSSDIARIEFRTPTGRIGLLTDWLIECQQATAVVVTLATGNDWKKVSQEAGRGMIEGLPKDFVEMSDVVVQLPSDKWLLAARTSLPCRGH